MATPEVKVKTQIKKILDDVGAYYVMPISGGFGNSGALDYSVCIRGRYVGIEAKAGKNKPTALQLYHMTQIRKAGGLAFVVNEENLEDFKNELKRI